MKKQILALLLTLVLLFSACNAPDGESTRAPQSESSGDTEATLPESESSSGTEEGMPEEAKWQYAIDILLWDDGRWRTESMVENTKEAVLLNEFGIFGVNHVVDDFEEVREEEKTALQKSFPFSKHPFLYRKTYYRYPTANWIAENPKEATMAESFGDFYGAVDEYVRDEGGLGVYYLQYLAGTDVLLDYRARNAVYADAPALSADALLEKAEEFLLAVLGGEGRAKYVLADPLPTEVSGSEYLFTYHRYHEGYLTDERILLRLSPSGNVTRYQNRYFGKYDAVSLPTKAALEKTEQKLRAEIASWNEDTLTVGSTVTLSLNTKGEAFLAIGYQYPTENPDFLEGGTVTMTEWIYAPVAEYSE